MATVSNEFIYFALGYFGALIVLMVFLFVYNILSIFGLNKVIRDIETDIREWFTNTDAVTTNPEYASLEAEGKAA